MPRAVLFYLSVVIILCPIARVAADWRLIDSPIILHSTFSIPSGTSFTIEPGVVVKSDPGVFILVEGTLTARGTLDKKIIFTSSQANPDQGSWGGISIYGPGASASQFTHCTIEYSDAGLAIGIQASPSISDTTSIHNRYGFRIDSANPTLNRLMAAHNEIGFDIKTSGIPSSPQITNSIIVENRWGVYLFAYSDLPVPNPRFYNNLIYNNRYGDVAVTGNWTPGTTLNLENNWWGIANESYIGSRIVDGASSPGQPIAVVDYIPFAVNPPFTPFFNDVTAISPIASLHAPWVTDYESDGDIDAFDQSKLYVNNGFGAFDQFNFNAIDRVPIDNLNLDGDGLIDVIAHASDPNCGYPTCQDPHSFLRYDSTINYGFDFVTTLSPHSNWDGTTDGRFADLDGDGDLDCFAGGYSSFSGNKNQTAFLYLKEQGTSTMYELVSYNPLPTGITVLSMTGVIRDFDNDGDLDVYAPATSGFEDEIDIIWRNLGNKNFEKVVVSSELGKGWAQRAEDFDNDGDFDLLLGEYLLLNNGNMNFSPGPDHGIDLESAGFQQAEVGDLNNDGFLDIVTSKEVGDARALRIYWNQGGGQFAHSLPDTTLYLKRQNINSGLFALTDINNDGRLDAYLRGTVLLNPGGTPANNWLRVRLFGTEKNRDAIGARITITANGRLQTREIESGTDSERIAHFGLGTATKVDSLSVRWPDGSTRSLSNLPINRLMFIGLPGDFNFDGTVDGSDFLAWQRGLGTLFTQADLNIWRTNMGSTVANRSSVIAPLFIQSGTSAPAGNILEESPKPELNSGTITGSVRTHAGRLLKNINVRVGDQSVKSDLNGAYSFTLAEGNYLMRASRKHYRCVVGSQRGPQSLTVVVNPTTERGIEIFCRRKIGNVPIL